MSHLGWQMASFRVPTVVNLTKRRFGRKGLADFAWKFNETTFSQMGSSEEALWGIASPNKKHEQCFSTKQWYSFVMMLFMSYFWFNSFSLTSFFGCECDDIFLHQHVCSSQASSPTTAEDVSACLVMQRGTRSLHGVTLREAASPGTLGGHWIYSATWVFIDFLVVIQIHALFKKTCFVYFE